MKGKDHLNGAAYAVEDITPAHWMKTYHEFFDSWASVLTPVEYLVFHSIVRVANFESGVSKDWWSVAGAAKVTGLNPKTVRVALSALRQHRIVVTVQHAGKAAEIHINQSVKTPEGTIRPRQNRVDNLPRPLPATGSGPLPATGRGPLPATGSTPLPATGSGPLPATGSTPLPAAGTPSYTPRDSSKLDTIKHDDDGGGVTPAKMVKELEAWNLVIDQQMAERMAKGLQDARPGILQAEVTEMVIDLLPQIVKGKRIHTPAAYLLTSMIRRAIGETFEIYRKRASAKREEQERAERVKRNLDAERRDFWEREKERERQRQAQRPATS